jgi:hypothetical protein
MGKAEYFVRRGGRQHGPTTSAKIRQLAALGKLSEDDLVRRGEAGAWVRAGDIRGVFGDAMAPADGQSQDPSGSLADDQQEADPFFVSPAKPLWKRIRAPFLILGALPHKFAIFGVAIGIAAMVTAVVAFRASQSQNGERELVASTPDRNQRNKPGVPAGPAPEDAPQKAQIVADVLSDGGRRPDIAADRGPSGTVVVLQNPSNGGASRVAVVPNGNGSGPRGGVAPNGDGSRSRGGVAPNGDGGRPRGGVAPNGNAEGMKLGKGIYRLGRNRDNTWTVPMFPIQQGEGIRGPSEYPPEGYLLRHATEIYGLKSAASDGACQFEIALPLPLDIGEYRRLETILWLGAENLDIAESEVRSVQQEHNTFLYFKARTEGKKPGDKAIYLIRCSWMMVPAFFAQQGKHIASEAHPWALELQAEAARRAGMEIAAAQSAGVSPSDKRFQQCARCAIDLRNVSEKQLLVVAGHWFADQLTGPKTWVEVLHAWNMSVGANIIVDGTGGDYVGPQGCNFFPTRIYPDCATVNDPFSLNVGGGTVLKTKMNTLSLATTAGNGFANATSSMRVYFDTPETWGTEYNQEYRRQKIEQMTRLFDQEVAVRERVNSGQ